MRHRLQEFSRTGAAVTRRRIIERIAVALAAGYFLFAASENGVAESEKPDPWQNAQLFTKPLDQAVKYGQPINPLKPPPLSVSFLIGDSEELTATADYINLGKKRVTLHGRKIKDATGDEERFYPYARLEVSDQTDRGWKNHWSFASGDSWCPGESKDGAGQDWGRKSESQVESVVYDRPEPV